MPKSLLRKAARNAILLFPLTRAWYERGYFGTAIRRQRFVNFVFKFVFRLNADCPWSVHYTSRVLSPEKLALGKGVEQSLMLSGGCYIQARNGVSIGDGTLFGPGVKFVSSNHDPDDSSRPCLEARPIRIGARCWLGANVIVLPGVEIGDDTVVGAGAVVTKSLPADVVAAGNPARVIRAVRRPGNGQ